MANPRVYNLGTAADYAKLHGVSIKAARDRLRAVPGAVKTGKGWRVPILSTDYAKVKGISASTARRSGIKLDTTSSPLIKTVVGPDMSSAKKVPWKRVEPVNMYGLGRLSSNQYQYQGSAVVRFKASGDVVEVYTHTITSSVPLSYTRLDQLIRQSIKHQLGTSPYEILSTQVVRAKSTHPKR